VSARVETKPSELRKAWNNGDAPVSCSGRLAAQTVDLETFGLKLSLEGEEVGEPQQSVSR
jgi:hypothetical protein